jgi:hypothetical protein
VSESVSEQLPRQQCAGAVLMIRPAAFDYNPETAATNSLQQRPAQEHPAEAGDGANSRARAEFEQVVRALESEGITVCVVDDTAAVRKPDAVFPNNWISFHADGTVVLYPMQAESRRRERRLDVIDIVAARVGFSVSRVVDLTHYEAAGHFLEGTGSLVLDHVNGVAYAGASPRTHPEVVETWARELGYEPFVFETRDRTGAAIYHTNVMMCIGERAAVVGSEAIAPRDRERVLARLAASQREIIEIGNDAVEQFAGNMLELASWDEALGDCRIFVMSTSARSALGPEAFAQVSACTDGVLVVPLPTIEKLGGGSVRCMLAEVFLPV